jgi:hypothetical protein
LRGCRRSLLAALIHAIFNADPAAQAAATTSRLTLYDERGQHRLDRSSGPADRWR